MIVPDSKDWTWVLDHPCPDCGFDASTCQAAAVAALITENARVWEQLLATDAISPTRPDDSTWSSLEYLCHVRDVYRRYDQRVALMLDEHDPLFPNWDQDASAIEDRYNEQDPADVAPALLHAAEALADRFETVTGDLWQRAGTRSDGAKFSVHSFAQYLIHDPIHHLHDVHQGNRALATS